MNVTTASEQHLVVITLDEQRYALRPVALIADAVTEVITCAKPDLIAAENILPGVAYMEGVVKLIENLHRSLVDGGWLIVSPAETSNSLFSKFTAVRFPGVVLYRKLADTESPAVATAYPAAAPGLLPEALPPERLVADAALATPLHEAPLNLDRSAAQPDEVPPFEVNAGEAPFRTARACANQGKLAEAAEWCEKAIAADKLNPAHQYLLATIRQELGQSDVAKPTPRGGEAF